MLQIWKSFKNLQPEGFNSSNCKFLEFSNLKTTETVEIGYFEYLRAQINLSTQDFVLFLLL